MSFLGPPTGPGFRGLGWPVGAMAGERKPGSMPQAPVKVLEGKEIVMAQKKDLELGFSNLENSEHEMKKKVDLKG